MASDEWRARKRDKAGFITQNREDAMRPEEELENTYGDCSTRFGKAAS